MIYSLFYFRQLLPWGAEEETQHHAIPTANPQLGEWPDTPALVRMFRQFERTRSHTRFRDEIQKRMLDLNSNLIVEWLVSHVFGASPT